MPENSSFEQKTLDSFWEKAEEAENIPNSLIAKLKLISNQAEINSTEIINLIKENSGEQNA